MLITLRGIIMFFMAVEIYNSSLRIFTFARGIWVWTRKVLWSSLASSYYCKLNSLFRCWIFSMYRFHVYTFRLSLALNPCRCLKSAVMFIFVDTRTIRECRRDLASWHHLKLSSQYHLDLPSTWRMLFYPYSDQTLHSQPRKQRAGTSLLWRKAERVGVVQPGEEKVMGRPYCSLLTSLSKRIL